MKGWKKIEVKCFLNRITNVTIEIRTNEHAYDNSKFLWYELGESFLDAGMHKGYLEKEFSFGHSYLDRRASSIGDLCKLIGGPSFRIYRGEHHTGRPHTVWKAVLDDDTLKELDDNPKKLLPILIASDYMIRDAALCAGLATAQDIAYDSKYYGEFSYISKSWMQQKLAKLAREILREDVVLVPKVSPEIVTDTDKRQAAIIRGFSKK